MAWVTTVDERYIGTYISYRAGTYDAPYSTTTDFTLAPGIYAYGALIPYAFTADADGYSLGILGAGQYVIVGLGTNWDTTNSILGLAPTTIQVHNQSGTVVYTSNTGSLYFTLSTAQAVYVSVVGSSLLSSEYSLAYSPNYTGTVTLAIDGDKTAGSTLTSTYSVTDLNGATNIAPSYQWAASSDGLNWTNIAGATSRSYTTQLQDIGKYLRVGFAYTDNDGFLEIFYSQATTKIEVDTTKPTLLQALPSNGTYTSITTDLDFIFSENIQKGTGNITLKKSDGTLIQTFDISNSQNITIYEKKLTLNATNDLDHSTTYKVEFSNTAISDSAGNTFLQSTPYSFTTVSASSFVTPSQSPSALTTDLVINAMTNGYTWNLSENRTIDWSISKGFSNEYWLDPDSVIEHVNFAMGTFSYYTNVKFNYLGYFNSPQEAATYGSEINVTLDGANKYFSSNNTLAIGLPAANAYNSNLYQGAPGDIYFNALSPSNYLTSYELGGDGWVTLIHEIGHTLGLKHPHDDGGTGRPTFSSLGFSSLDIDWASIMSYEDTASANVFSWDPGGPMILDVIALQYIYGKNNETNSGDTLFNLTNYPFYSTIWDASGTDTVDVSTASKSWTIQLPNFQISSLVDTNAGFAIPTTDLQAIANAGTPTSLVWLAGDFENATGTTYNDYISGNALSNVLIGGAGNDTLVGGGNSDVLIGDAGNDISEFTGVKSHYKIEFKIIPNYYGYTSAYKVTSLDDSSNQTFLLGIETVTFSDGTFLLSEISPADTTAPTVSSFSPADEASAVAISSNIVVTFSENIQRGAGNIVLKTAEGTTVATYAQASSNVTISGSTLTINPTVDLSYSTGYKVEFASGSVQDLAGNDYAGTTSYNFTSAVQGANSLASGIKISNWRNGTSLSGVTLSDGQPVKTAPIDKASSGITLTDVLAALKIYLGKSVGDYSSPLNYITSDFNADGSVTLTDVLSLLKYYLGKDTGGAKPTWVFIDATDMTGTGSSSFIAGMNGQSISKTYAIPKLIQHDLSTDSTVELIGVLRGDVDGSWSG